MVEYCQAQEQDVATLVAYGETFWKETIYYKEWGVEYDSYSVANMTRHLMNTGLVYFAHEKDDRSKIVGMILMVESPLPMNNAYRITTEWVFYVDENWRNKGVGQQLIADAEWYMKQTGHRFMSMISLTNVTPEAAEGLYKSLGYQQTETSFTKELI